jgi:hypothetical protein
MRVIDQSGVARVFEVNRARLEARIAALSEEIARLDAQLDDARTPRTPRGTMAPDVEDVVGALRPGEGLLMQVTGETGSHLFWLDGDGQVYARTGLGTPALSDHVARLRASIEVANVGPDEPLPAVPLDAAHALFAGLFGPFEDRMRAVERVVFVADGAARALPMSMLVTRDHGAVSVSEPEALGRIEWLGAQKAISVMPSPRAFVALRDQPERPPAALDFVGIGNPAFARESYALPETETELVHLAGILSGAGRHAIATGPEASEAWVRSAAAVREARVLAFATHGLVNRELGVQEPALMLATPEGETHEDDGFLTASEIAMLDLRADWVILSACNTAAGRDDRAEGLSGLASSFFAAGARSLLVSHWYVPSSAAAALTVFTADAMATTGASRDEALRQAMARVRAGAGLGDAPNPRFAHPAYWAPFVIVGAPE